MLTLKTPAKINLFLNLRDFRADGFHEVCFLMQAIALWDTLTITPTLEEGPGIQFQCYHPGLTGDLSQNLVVKAYHLFWEETQLTPLGLQVSLKKGIPVQAGLGGGSSDAAAMLLALNHLTGSTLSPTALRILAAHLGSDVPFFVSGGTALATGRGEQIQPVLTPLPTLPLLVIKPKNLDVSTPWAYQAVRAQALVQGYVQRPIEPLLQTLKQDPTYDSIEPYLFNDFESVLFQRFPQLLMMADEMRAAGIVRPLLSGSGPSMVGFAEGTPAQQQLVQERFPAEYYEVFWTHTHSGSVIQAVS